MSFAFLTRAQLAVGSWQIYSSMGDPVKVIDTGDRVYYVSGISLFCFDKETEEMESYNKNNLLNDIDVANIYYNYDKNYLVVVYANSNIDILYDNGKVYNIPDIKNAIMTSSKSVNDVKFYGKPHLLGYRLRYCCTQRREVRGERVVQLREKDK